MDFCLLYSLGGATSISRLFYLVIGFLDQLDQKLITWDENHRWLMLNVLWKCLKRFLLCCQQANKHSHKHAPPKTVPRDVKYRYRGVSTLRYIAVYFIHFLLLYISSALWLNVRCTAVLLVVYQSQLVCLSDCIFFRINSFTTDSWCVTARSVRAVK